MLQLWLIVPLDVVEACSVHVALFWPEVETWTIVHVCADEVLLEETEPPPPLAVQLTELVPPAVVNCRTRCDFVQFHPLPGHLAPA